jgi:membrane-associated protein
MSSHEITHLIHAYGLLAVFLGAGLQAVGLPLPGGTVLVVAAVDAATKHGLPVVGVIASGAFGALAGTICGYMLGRWRGEAILLRLGRLFRQSPERVHRLRAQLGEHALLPLFLARFITGARNLAGLAAGASDMPLPPFLAVSASAALAWSAMITLEYFFAGHALLGAPTWLQVLLIVLGILATVLSFRLLRPGGWLNGEGAGPPPAPSPPSCDVE